MAQLVEHLLVLVPGVLLAGAALAGLSALVLGVGRLTQVAKLLLVSGGALWLFGILVALLWPTAITSDPIGRLHLWFSGTTAAIALLTLAGARLERLTGTQDGRFQTVGLVLTGMLAVIAMFYAHAAVTNQASAASGSDSDSDQPELSLPKPPQEACGELEPDILGPPAVCEPPISVAAD